MAVAYLPAMPVCPNCHDEYEDGVATCASCHVPLLPDGAALPPRVDRLLGTFHPLVVGRVTGLLSRRGISHDTVAVEEDRIEVIVDRTWRDDVRAELTVNWTDIVTGLDPDDMYRVLAAGGAQPGWYDAPTTAWVDRDGRLQVDPGEDEEALEDARRLWGPTLVVIGIVVGLFGWYGERSAILLLLGGAVAVTGLLMPR